MAMRGLNSQNRLLLEKLCRYIFEADVLTFVVLIKAEMHVLYTELVGTTEFLTL